MKRILLSIQLLLLVFTTFASDLYLIGNNVNGKCWSMSEPDAKMEEKAPGIYEWSGTMLESKFKINNGVWDDGVNIGSVGEELTLGKKYYYINDPNSQDIVFSDAESLQDPHVVLDMNAGTLIVTGRHVSLENPAIVLYVIGESVNGKRWTLSSEDAKFKNKGNGIYEWQGEFLASEFKIHDDSWGYYGCNIGSNGSPLDLGVPYPFVNFTDDNIAFNNVSAIENPCITLDLNSCTVVVEGTPAEYAGFDPFDVGDLYMIGDNINGNHWLLKDSSAKFSYKGKGIYEWKGKYMNSGFKINNGSWEDVDDLCLNFGAGDDDSGLILGEPYKLTASSDSGNIGFYGLSEIINPFVTLNVENQTVTVTFSGHNLQINLPQSDNKFENCILELIDNSSGNKTRQILSDRRSYIFKGVESENNYSIRLLSPLDIEIAAIENYIMPDKDSEIEFSGITPLFNVEAVVLTPDGSNITSDTSLEWYDVTDNQKVTFLKNTPALCSMPQGQKLLCKVILGKDYGCQYMNPEDVELTVDKQNSSIAFNLQRFKTTLLEGKLTDSDNRPLRDASVAGTILLNDKYLKILNTKTDSEGRWSLQVTDSPEISLSYSISGYIKEEKKISDFRIENSKTDLGTTVLKEISGPTIEYNLNYKDAYTEEVESPYSDYRNVEISIVNPTQNRTHEKLSNQYPLIVIMDDEIKAGDELELTVSSKTNAFDKFNHKVKLPESLKTSTTITILGKGALKSSFKTTDNINNIGLLYNSEGEFLEKQKYVNATTVFKNLEEGNYKLITMGNPDFINCFSRLSGFDEIGLIEGKDYIINDVTIKKGAITEIKNDVIPAFNENRFYYTSSSSYFSVNKSNITTGGILTFSSAIEFKDEYKDAAKELKMIIEFPENTEFIENSVIHGSNLIPYTIDNNRLEINIENNYATPLRFCLIPTRQGLYNASAFVSFNYNGSVITQPIGSAVSSIKDISIVAPSIISEQEITVRGNANINSKVKVFWDDAMVGTTTVNSFGEWDIHLELDEMKPYTMHNLYATIETEKGSSLTSETKSILYDNDVPRVFGVEMINQAHRYGIIGPEITYFDYVGNYPVKPYWFLPSYPTFTFRAVVKKGVQTDVTDLTIFALTEGGDWVPMQAKYDKKQDYWVASHNFTYGSLPVNVGVSFNYISNEISPERLARQFLDNYNASLLKKKDYDIKDFNYEQIGNLLNFTYDLPYSGGMRINSIESLDNFGSRIEYVNDNFPLILTTATEGVNILPQNCEEFKLDKNFSYYVLQTEETAERSISMYFSRDHIKALLETKAAENEEAFDFLRNLLNKYSSYKFIAIKSVQEGEQRNEMAKCSLCDEADRNCPDFSAITDRIRNKENHQRNMNNRLDRFKNVLDWTGRAADLVDESGTISGATGLVGNAMDLGQAGGNFALNMSNNEDFAALRGAGCLPNNGDSPTYPSQTGNAGYASDPAGYVYEAVPSNRVEGVQTSIYHIVRKENMYGDITEEPALWDAEEYGQENPLFTDKNGIYQWDVPNGLWQVKAEKDGYVTSYSEWLPVPPPQLDVNLSIVSLKEPEIQNVHAYPSGVEIEFSKYMDLSTLTVGNILVYCNDKCISGEILPLNAESPDDSDSVKYASRVKFVPENGNILDINSVILVINSNVMSYAGVKMISGFKKEYNIEPEIYAVYAQDLDVLYDGEKEFIISVLPPEAAVGKTLHISSSADMIASIDQNVIVVDDKGNAIVTVKGETLGLAVLSFSFEDSNVKGESVVRVVNSISSPESPKASKASGSEVYKGSEISLSTETDNGVIYYTLDGNCPCDDTPSRIRYTSPIIINEDTQILAITISESDPEESSEVVEFIYKIKRHNQNLELEDGWNWISHSMANNQSAGVFFNNNAVESITGVSSCVKKNDWIKEENPSFNLSPLSLFKIKASKATTVNIEDDAIDPSSSLSLNTGFNWIGYPLSEIETLDDVIHGCKKFDIIIGQHGFAQYDGSTWKGTLKVLTPGEGYIYHCETPLLLTFANPDIDKDNSDNKTKEINASSGLNIRSYPDIFPIILKVVNEGKELAENSFKIIVEAEKELRGIGIFEEGLGYTSVYGNNGDQIQIVVTDNSNRAIAKRELVFDSEGLLGDIENPYIIDIYKDISSIESIYSVNEMETSINDGFLTVHGLPEENEAIVEIFDLDGSLILKQHLTNRESLNLNHIDKGIYFLRISSSGFIYSNKLII